MPKSRINSKPKLKKSRAVLRGTTPGEYIVCAQCGEQVKYRAQVRNRGRIICNVYVRGKWNRVEHYHEDCYLDAGEPYGDADRNIPVESQRRRAF